jgi:hypothetical protein
MTGNKGTFVLQERDRALLKFLSEFQLVDREQTKIAVGFGSTTRVNARLLALTRAGLLNRFFIGSVGASRKAVYTLSRTGASVAEVPYRRVRHHENGLIGADLSIGHQLHLNATYLALRSCSPEMRIRNWNSFKSPLSKTIQLKPDGYFEYSNGGIDRAAFLEVDMGTETRKVWRKKVREYLLLAVSGEFSRIFSPQQQFRTLVITMTEKRLKSIMGTIEESTDKIFFGTTFESINHQTFWSPIWLRPGKTEKVSLL